MSLSKIKNSAISASDQSVTDNNLQGKLFHLSPVGNKKVELSFSANPISSDGGLLLLKETKQTIGLFNRLSSCLTDTRNQGYVKHSYQEIFSQRILQIAAGYEDANDCNSLRKDLLLKSCVNRMPEDADLASQPTISRLENNVSWRELYQMAITLVDTFIESYDQEPSVIVLDCDDTNVNAYGNQQGILFNDYYGEYCFMPLHIYEGLSGKLIATILKPGRRNKSVNVFALLKRLIQLLRKKWKHTQIVLRGDSHFCCPQFMDWVENQMDVNFVTGLSGNSVLNAQVKPILENMQKRFDKSQKAEKCYTSFPYKAGSWKHHQRVIAKIEIGPMGTNVRFIVTDLKEYRTKSLYEEFYCARGNAELYIKEMKSHLKADRMSCTSFKANQFRLFMHAAAYVLMHTLRDKTLANTSLAKATFKTIREKIIKVGAFIHNLKTKIKIELPACYPYKESFSLSLVALQNLRE